MQQEPWYCYAALPQMLPTQTVPTRMGNNQMVPTQTVPTPMVPTPMVLTPMMPTHMAPYQMPLGANFGYAPQIQMPRNDAQRPRPKYVLTTCPFKNIMIAGIERQNGTCYFYKYNSIHDNMEPHLCNSCQPRVEEKHLNPLYVHYCEDTKEYVIFCGNSITYTIEQYTYSFQSGKLTEVFRPEIVFDRKKVINSTSVAVLKDDEEKEIVSIEKDGNMGLRKQKTINGRFEVQPPRLIKRLMMKTKQMLTGINDLTDYYEYDDDADDSEYSQFTDGGRSSSALNSDFGDFSNHEDDSEKSEVDDGFSHYLYSIVPLKIEHCPHLRKDYLCAFNVVNEKYSRFFFGDKDGDFQFFNCGICENHVCEKHLIPKYVENTDQFGKILMHAYNTFTGTMEQYYFNHLTAGFEQVIRSEFPYDATKEDPNVNSLFVITTLTTTAVIKDKNGHLKKEQYCLLKHRFMPAPPVEVKTVFMTRHEEQNSGTKRNPVDDCYASFKHLTHNQRPTQQDKLVGASASTTIHTNELNEMLDMIHVQQAQTDGLPTTVPAGPKPVDMSLVANELNKIKPTQHDSTHAQPEKVPLDKGMNNFTNLKAKEQPPTTYASAAKTKIRKEQTKTSAKSSQHDVAMTNSLKDTVGCGQISSNTTQVTAKELSHSSAPTPGFVNWEEFLRTNPTPAEVLAVIETNTGGKSKKSSTSKKAPSKK